MDYKNYYRSGILVVILFLTGIFFITCSDNKKDNINNTYYFELVNFTKDSLKKAVIENLTGKVSYYKNDKLLILSLNYVTEDHPDMHFFKNADELVTNLKPEIKKVKIKFGGEYSKDSITYSLQKYVYRNSVWVKTSDMGYVKGTTSYKKAKKFAIEEFAKQITNNVVVYTYN